jgi:flagellar hook-basal body complex protein FliE
MPVEVKGANEFRKALRKFDPDLYKAMNDEIKVVLKDVVADAKSNVPQTFLSGALDTGSERASRTSRSRAFPVYNATVIRKGLTYSMGKQKRNRSGWASLYTMLNKSAIGAIVETAGRKHPNGDPESKSNNPNAGRQFIQELEQEYGGLKQVGKGAKQRGRLIFSAVEKNQGKAVDAIMTAIEKAKRQFETRTK